MQRVGRSTLAGTSAWPQAPVGQVIDAPSGNIRPWVIFALTFFIAQTFSRLGDVFPLLQQIRPGLVSQAAFILVLLQKQSYAVLKAAATHPTFICVAILAVLAVVTVPTGAWPTASLEYLTSVYYASVFLFAAAVLAFSRPQTRRVVIFVVCGLAATVGVLGLLSANRWGFEMGMTYDQNVTAAYLVMVVPWVAAWAAFERNNILKLILLCVIPMLVMTVLRTGSRGGLLGLLVLIPFLYSVSPPRRRGLAIMMILGISVVLSLTGQAQFQRLRGSLFNRNDYNYTDQDGRKAVWKRGMSYLQEKPLTGQGINGFPYRELAWKLQYRGGGQQTEAHNMYIEVAVDLGLVGFGAFVTAFVASLVGVARLRRQAKRRFQQTGDRGDEELAVYGGAAAASLVSLVVTGFFLSVAHQAPVYFGLGAALGMIMAARFREGVGGPGTGAPVPMTHHTQTGSARGWRSRKSALQWRLRSDSARLTR